MEFPRLVFKVPGPMVRAGGTYAHRAVEDADDLAEAIDDGWAESIPDAIADADRRAAALIANPEAAPPTRAELEQKAGQLGIAFDARISDKRLAKLIDAKQTAG